MGERNLLHTNERTKSWGGRNLGHTNRLNPKLNFYIDKFNNALYRWRVTKVYSLLGQFLEGTIVC